MKKIYAIENLCCANCAAKIEEKLKALPEVEDLTLTFATKKLAVTAKNPDKLLPKLTEIAQSVEDGVIFAPVEEHHHETGDDGKVILIGTGLFLLGLGILFFIAGVKLFGLFFRWLGRFLRSLFLKKKEDE